MIFKTIKSISKGQELEILPLWKEDEYEFTQIYLERQYFKKKKMILQCKIILRIEERLATMDSLLMNLAITEALEFSSIP